MGNGTSVVTADWDYADHSGAMLSGTALIQAFAGNPGTCIGITARSA